MPEGIPWYESPAPEGIPETNRTFTTGC